MVQRPRGDELRNVPVEEPRHAKPFDYQPAPVAAWKPRNAARKRNMPVTPLNPSEEYSWAARASATTASIARINRLRLRLVIQIILPTATA